MFVVIGFVHKLHNNWLRQTKVRDSKLILLPMEEQMDKGKNPLGPVMCTLKQITFINSCLFLLTFSNAIS